MPTINRSPAPIAPSTEAPRPSTRPTPPSVSSNGWQPKPVTGAASTAAAPKAGPEHRRFEISIPSDRQGESLAVLNGMVTTVLDDVTLKMGKKTILGLQTKVELMAIGAPAELDRLQHVIRQTVDPSAGPGTAIDAREKVRFVFMHDPSVPNPSSFDPR